jgi:uncharacterized ubiquitin-like protein YukD
MVAMIFAKSPGVSVVIIIFPSLFFSNVCMKAVSVKHDFTKTVSLFFIPVNMVLITVFMESSAVCPKAVEPTVIRINNKKHLFSLICMATFLMDIKIGNTKFAYYKIT